MLSKSIQDALNEQVNHEFYSAFLYLSMTAYFESVNWPGFAAWVRAQSEEEETHAKKIFQYVIDRGGRATISAIDAPPVEFKSPRDVFEQVLAHEQKVTAMINNLYALAVKENDYAAQTYLQWFVNEQVEEEKNATLIVEQLKRIGESVGSQFALDHQLGKRGKAS
jgi:ferritin